MNELAFVAGLLLLLLGLFVVLSDAFRRRLRWGLSVLLIPVLYPVYAGMHWNEVAPRNGFLVSVVGGLLIIVAMYGGAGRNLPFVESSPVVKKLPTAAPPAEPLPNQAEAEKIRLPDGKEYDPLERGNQFIDVEIKPLAPKEDRQAAPPSRPVPDRAYRHVETEDISHYLGHPVRISLNNGQTRQGRLIENDEESLFIEQSVPKGLVSFQYKFTNIDTIEIYSEVLPDTPRRSGSLSNRPGSGSLPGDYPMAGEDSGDDTGSAAQPVPSLPEGVVAKPIPGTAEPLPSEPDSDSGSAAAQSKQRPDNHGSGGTLNEARPDSDEPAGSKSASP